MKGKWKQHRVGYISEDTLRFFAAGCAVSIAAGSFSASVLDSDYIIYLLALGFQSLFGFISGMLGRMNPRATLENGLVSIIFWSGIDSFIFLKFLVFSEKTIVNPPFSSVAILSAFPITALIAFCSFSKFASRKRALKSSFYLILQERRRSAMHLNIPSDFLGEWFTEAETKCKTCCKAGREEGEPARFFARCAFCNEIICTACWKKNKWRCPQCQGLNRSRTTELRKVG